MSTYWRLYLILVLILVVLPAAWLLSRGINVISLLGLVLPALFVAWLLVVWLPSRPFTWGIKVFLGVLSSTLVFGLSTLIQVAFGLSTLLHFAGVLPMAGAPTSIGDLDANDLHNFVWIFIYTIPVMLVSDALLYFGGLSLHSGRSLSRVVVGSVSTGLGVLLWMVSAFGQVFLFAIFVVL